MKKPDIMKMSVAEIEELYEKLDNGDGSTLDKFFDATGFGYHRAINYAVVRERVQATN